MNTARQATENMEYVRRLLEEKQAGFAAVRGIGRVRYPPSDRDLEDAEDTAAVLEWKARDTAGQTTFVPADEARRRRGMPR